MACITNKGDRRWPLGVVPFRIVRSSWPATERDSAEARILDGIAEWNDKTAVRLVERVGESDYVEFTGKVNPKGRCWSVVEGPGGAVRGAAIGRMGGRQVIGCEPTQQRIIHEIGHAVGFYHEQQRSDRDTYVTVNVAGLADPFNYGIPADSADVATYDCQSIMQDNANPFLSVGPGDLCDGIGPSGTTPSPADRDAADLMYRHTTIGVDEVVRGCMNTTGDVSLSELIESLKPAAPTVLRALLRLERQHCQLGHA